MRAIRTRPIADLPENIALQNQVFGSNRASQMLVDAVNGTDSIDVVTIGDSNSGYSGNYGHTVGWDRALGYTLGIPIYATPLCSANQEAIQTYRENGMMQQGIRVRSSGNNQAGASGTVKTLVQAAAAADTRAVELKGFLNFDSTNYGTASSMLPKATSDGFDWYGSFVSNGVTYTSAANNNLIQVFPSHPFCNGTGTGGQNLFYQVVYGKFSSPLDAGNGVFRPVVMQDSPFQVLATGSVVTASGGSSSSPYGITSPLLFTSPSTTPSTFYAGWDNFNQGSPAIGPVGILWHSIAKRVTKGYSVTNLMYNAGRSSTQLADRVEGMDKLLNSFLDGLLTRQTYSGGSGRLIVFMNSGINGSETGSSYTDAADRVKQRIRQRWLDIGGNANNIAFVFTLTHPTTASGSEPTWASNRPAISSAANAWAVSNATDGYNTCVVDIAIAYPAWKILLGARGSSMYDSGGQAHLNSTTTAQNNGYDGVTGSIVFSLLAR